MPSLIRKSWKPASRNADSHFFCLLAFSNKQIVKECAFLLAPCVPNGIKDSSICRKTSTRSASLTLNCNNGLVTVAYSPLSLYRLCLVCLINQISLKRRYPYHFLYVLWSTCRPYIAVPPMLSKSRFLIFVNGQESFFPSCSSLYHQCKTMCSGTLGFFFLCLSIKVPS